MALAMMSEWSLRNPAKDFSASVMPPITSEKPLTLSLEPKEPVNSEKESPMAENASPNAPATSLTAVFNTVQ